jgi:AcrR family transcriptional regulator
MASGAPVTSRGRATRERILSAAADLVADRGFHAVGVSDIGAAAGVTGAALYRHFETKTGLLVALFERAVDGLLDGARQIIAAGAAPEATLDELVASHVEFALTDRATLTVYGREAHNLPDDDRRRLRRTQRQYVELWKQVLCDVEPALDPAISLTRVEAVFGMLNSTRDLTRAVGDDVLAVELGAMAAAALRAPHPRLDLGS